MVIHGCDGNIGPWPLEVVCKGVVLVKRRQEATV